MKPLCDLLSCLDNKVIQVALDGLENILRVGEEDRITQGSAAVNQYAIQVEEQGGMDAIQEL